MGLLTIVFHFLSRQEEFENFAELQVHLTFLQHAFVDQNLLLGFFQVWIEVEHQSGSVFRNLRDHWSEYEAKDLLRDILLVLVCVLISLVTRSFFRLFHL